ncbi:ion transporter [Alcaligenaceae bacterium CGII-47]|nr:ion transporter [Alcaligenaceae bacterium CGII-47]
MIQDNRPKRSRPVRAIEDFGKPSQGWRYSLYVIIFEADTKAGKRFDMILIIAIILSLMVIMAASVESLSSQYDALFQIFEWIFTLLFTVEYVIRLICVQNRWRYALSFYGLVDLLAIAPTYAALLMPSLTFLIGVRVLRLLRIFRVFKLVAFVDEYVMLGRALRASARKILVFLSVVLSIVLVMGTIMYVVEGPAVGFTSIPASVYWAITTLSTVGFGDITPQTGLGRFIASVMMLLGWGVLAVPTGIVTLELSAAQSAMRIPVTTRTCHECLTEGLDADANYCKACGVKLPEYQRD